MGSAGWGHGHVAVKPLVGGAVSDYGGHGEGDADAASARESQGLLSKADAEGGPGPPGVSPLNVYKMSRKEWLLAMWRAPSCWDSWRLLKDGRHQVQRAIALRASPCVRL